MRVKNLGTALGAAEKSDPLMLQQRRNGINKEMRALQAPPPVFLLPKYPYAHQHHFALYEGPALPHGAFAYSVPSLVWLPMLPPRIFLWVIFLKVNSIYNR